MSAEHDGLDALMAALTDEPLPESAAADPAFLAEHRSARADIALLKEQLAVIGGTLAETAPAAQRVPVRPSRTRRRARTFAFGTLAVAAAASVVTGLGWLLGHSGAQELSSGGSADSDAKAEAGVRFGGPAYLACAATVAEGEVTMVKELPATGELQVTVHVTRYFKPDRGTDHLTYVIGAYDLPEPFTRGTRVLFGVTEGSPSPDQWVVGEQQIARERAWIVASLPQSRTMPC
ncbi:hypothetical protein M2164_005511 [Streptomyces sp. SAI-208]|jgi:hypothetical protein|uniref:hypothetical protein n=1 Tax=unclassified Streptomyces TaxID=2593676 RepID=UPI0024738918|nr:MULTISPECIES: hypothetical protein [unclassified Streptomyces]MDH6519029.1 hypothetical protein [Streptomyces sp. SAI-090]MDH6551250.1 hypothetical protein [Streptomyces sp. SAI-041]MDH6570315.1 hypothetical protein [Streptomyces sp. SAI-117]MDH6584713.1 hypothetical protein [Streptomyces sp. SAI-133]MDH6609876.1 hypothetical protein [Streptomyces sp. SAI-208]